MLRKIQSSLLVLLIASVGQAQLSNQNNGGTNIGGGLTGGGGAGGGGAASVFGNQQAGEGSGISGVLSGRGDSTVGGSGFLGRSDQAAAGFMAGQGASQGATNFGNAGNFGGRGGGGVGGRAGAANGQPQQQQSTRVIRTRITIPRDFGRVVIAPSRIEAGLNGQFRRASNLRRSTSRGADRISTTGLQGSRISVTTSSREVVLTGQVASNRDKMIAEKMAKMEPGVDSVINQLVVTP